MRNVLKKDRFRTLSHYFFVYLLQKHNYLNHVNR